MDAFLFSMGLELNLADKQRPKAMFFIQCCGRRLPITGLSEFREWQMRHNVKFMMSVAYLG